MSLKNPHRRTCITLDMVTERLVQWMQDVGCVKISWMVSLLTVLKQWTPKWLYLHPVKYFDIYRHHPRREPESTSEVVTVSTSTINLRLNWAEVLKDILLGMILSSVLSLEDFPVDPTMATDVSASPYLLHATSTAAPSFPGSDDIRTLAAQDMCFIGTEASTGPEASTGCLALSASMVLAIRDVIPCDMVTFCDKTCLPQIL